VCIYIYIYIYICVCVCFYICIKHKSVTINAAFLRKQHTHKHLTTAVLPLVEDLWMSCLWWLLDLLLLSVEFQILERNGELSQFLSVGNRQQSRVVWLGYSLFCDQILLHCERDVTRRMYMERYQNVVQYLEDYTPNGIHTDFQKYTINTAIPCLCYRHKQAQIVQKHIPFDFWFAAI
jgi:hypothetical protein